MKNEEKFSSSELVENAFYLAFEQCDIEMMMSVWSRDQDISCIHPGGPRLEGLDNIQDSWEQIFSHEQGITFELKHKKVFVEDNIAIHRVIEAISLNGKLSSEIVATNVYCKTNDGWHMILHHASPELHTRIDASELDEMNDSQTVH